VDTHPNDLWVKTEIAHVRSSLARLLGGHGHERAGREPASVWWLGRLPDGWYLVNDISIDEGARNIDHLLLGPPGVFAINARNVNGTVWVGAGGVRVNGHATDFVHGVVHEARRASRQLTAALERTVDVRPVLAILADGWSVQEPHDDVFIGPPRSVKDWLRRLAPVLNAGEVGEIRAVATAPVTWEPL